MGDNGQAPMNPSKKKCLIDLREKLSNYQIMKLKKGVTQEDEVVLGVNERMAYIYTLKPDRVTIHDLVDTLKTDPRIDVLAWKEGEWIHVLKGGYDGVLHFSINGEFKDFYNQSWSIDGDPSILDLKLENHFISYRDYPDALARIHSSLHSHEGNFFVISARPGFEFIGEGSPTHVGGASHGGLHYLDSLIPMIITGTDKTPEYWRIIDIKKWLLRLTTEA